jgi:hypothetical protein
MYEGGLNSFRPSLPETRDKRPLVRNRAGAGVTATLRV